MTKAMKAYKQGVKAGDAARVARVHRPNPYRDGTSTNMSWRMGYCADRKGGKR